MPAYLFGSIRKNSFDDLLLAAPAVRRNDFAMREGPQHRQIAESRLEKAPGFGRLSFHEEQASRKKISRRESHIWISRRQSAYLSEKFSTCGPLVLAELAVAAFAASAVDDAAATAASAACAAAPSVVFDCR